MDESFEVVIDVQEVDTLLVFEGQVVSQHELKVTALPAVIRQFVGLPGQSERGLRG